MYSVFIVDGRNSKEFYVSLFSATIEYSHVSTVSGYFLPNDLLMILDHMDADDGGILHCSAPLCVNTSPSGGFKKSSSQSS